MAKAGDNVASYSTGPVWHRGTLTANFTLTPNKTRRSSTEKIGDAEWYFTVSASPVFSSVFNQPTYYYPNISVYCKRNSSDVTCDCALMARWNDSIRYRHFPEQKHLFTGETLESSFSLDMVQYDVQSSSHVFGPNVISIAVDVSVKEEKEEKKNIYAKTVDEIGDRGANIFSPEFLPDCVLILTEKRVMVNKKFMSSQSGFFDKMFNSEFKEKDQQEIELKEINHSDFVELLFVLYDLRSIIVENVESVLKLADYFAMKSIVDKCKYFLELDQKIPTKKKVLMSQEYHLDELLKHCLKKYTCFADLKKLKNDQELFKKKTLKFIYARFLEIDH